MAPRQTPVTAIEADTYRWWSDFLEARMVAIQSMLALGRDDADIARSIGVDAVQVALLIETARKRQGKK